MRQRGMAMAVKRAPDRELFDARLDLAARALLPAPPGGDVGQFERLAEQMARERGEEGKQRARFDQSRSGHVRNHHAARAHRLHQPGDAQVRSAVQFQRIDVVRVDAPPEDVRALEPRDRPYIDLVVARDEIVPLHEQQAQIARQMRLLEIGLAVWTGRQQADARIGALPRRRRGYCGRRRRRAQAARTFIARVELGKGARQHQPVLERIAQPRWGLGAVVQHPPSPVGAAPEIGGVELQARPPGRRTPRIARTKSGLPGDRGGGKMAFANQPCRAVEIAQHGFEQRRRAGRCLRRCPPIPPHRAAAATARAATAARSPRHRCGG